MDFENRLGSDQGDLRSSDGDGSSLSSFYTQHDSCDGNQPAAVLYGRGNDTSAHPASGPAAVGPPGEGVQGTFTALVVNDSLLLGIGAWAFVPDPALLPHGIILGVDNDDDDDSGYSSGYSSEDDD